MKIRSLNAQLLISVSVLLAMFFGFTIFALDMVFRDISERAIRDRLELQVLALISASEVTRAGTLEPGPQLAEARFNNPGSGLYGEIHALDGALHWRSNSMTGTGVEFSAPLKPGERGFGESMLPDGSRVLVFSQGLDWEFSRRRSSDVVFSVAENLEPYYAQLNRFRGQLFGWFTALMVLLLIALAVVFRRVLSPLRRIEREIGEIEEGTLSALGSGYPSELDGVTTNMNALLKGERERLERYRNTLGNLAHSLKTPLAVIRNQLSAQELRDVAAARQLDEQVNRMDDIVRYQLKRAAASAGTGLGTAPVDIHETMTALRATLLKVYADRALDIRLDIDPACRFSGDKGDLLEIAGNLLDNACKWSRHSVVLAVSPMTPPRPRRGGVVLMVEDDGPGIAAAERTRVLERGARLDERVQGQGIGLSVVRELAALSGGDVQIDSSPLGGARVIVTLPAM